MSDNVLQTLQQLVQDVLAPDIRELKTRMSSLEKDIDTRFGSVDSRFNSMEKQMNLMERTILSAIGELKPKPSFPPSPPFQPSANASPS